MRPAISYGILCDGSFPENESVLQQLLSCDVVLCCDGAAANFVKYRKPEFVVGDMDSLSPDYKELLLDCLLRETEQETNDLSKAFRVVCALLQVGGNHYLPDFSIKIFGATGKREDHTLGNISLLAEYNKALSHYGFFGKISLVTDYGMFIPINTSVRMRLSPGQQLSIFAFDTQLQISSIGLDYPTDGVIFDMWWKATLNRVSEGGVVELNLSKSSEVLLYFPSYFEELSNFITLL